MMTKLGSKKFGIFDAGADVPVKTISADAFKRPKDGFVKFYLSADGYDYRTLVEKVPLQADQSVKQIVESQDSEPDINKGRCLANTFNVGE
jgi:hypothetical protein